MGKTSNKDMPPKNFNTGVFVAWHHVRVVVPHDWEVTAYSVEDRIGRMDFGTREGLKATLSWEPCQREPDRLSTMKTFIKNNILRTKSNAGLDMVHTEEVGAFIIGWMDDSRVPCQALAYDKKTQHLVMWVFEGERTQKYRENTIKGILNSFDFNDDDLCEYSLYGIHCLLPREYKIEDIVTMPANVMMLFENEKSMRRVVFRRWGMAKMLRGNNSLYDFYKPIARQLNMETELLGELKVNNMEAIRVRFSGLREHHGDRFMRRRWHNGDAIIWHNTEENRIYAFEQIGPEKSIPLQFSSVFKGLSLK